VLLINSNRRIRERSNKNKKESQNYSAFILSFKRRNDQKVNLNKIERTTCLLYGEELLRDNSLLMIASTEAEEPL